MKIEPGENVTFTADVPAEMRGRLAYTLLSWRCGGCDQTYQKKFKVPEEATDIRCAFWCPRCTPLWLRFVNWLRELLPL